jgi:hypothetical protein
LEEVWKQGVVKQKISAASFQPIPSPAITPSVSEHPGAIWSFQLPATIQTVRFFPAPSHNSVREPVARFCVFILVGRQWSKANR